MPLNRKQLKLLKGRQRRLQHRRERKTYMKVLSILGQETDASIRRLRLVLPEIRKAPDEIPLFDVWNQGDAMNELVSALSGEYRQAVEGSVNEIEWLSRQLAGTESLPGLDINIRQRNSVERMDAIANDILVQRRPFIDGLSSETKKAFDAIVNSAIKDSKDRDQAVRRIKREMKKANMVKARLVARTENVISLGALAMRFISKRIFLKFTYGAVLTNQA